jgi:hypothetical protein
MTESILKTILTFLEILTVAISFYFTNKCRENKNESETILKDLKRGLKK